ncbi:MAG: GDP-mannose 4,6-dehydratase, partial [Endomicrobia bacterium]|nr:GDP-mannose 4,6-dehydratase [Endomicrobiia bacterium]
GVVAIFAKRMLEGKALSVYGDGPPVRDFVYVSDVVDANLMCIEKESKSGIYNVGTGEKVSINNLYKLLSRITGYKKTPIYQPPRKGELRKSWLDINKISTELGWQPKVKFEDGISKVVDYFKKGCV